jgi:hypothetical protein
MSREHGIPLVLWICTAIVMHLVTGGGAEQLATAIESRADLAAFALRVRDRIAPAAPMEVSLESPAVPEPVQKIEPATKPAVARSVPPKPKKVEPKPQPVIELPKVAASAAAPAPTTPPPELANDRRIAVRQHVEPNQEDNPNARFIGDEANHVAEETVARVTSHDQDDPNPTPGGHHPGPDTEPGNSTTTRIAESEDRPGEARHAPSESRLAPTQVFLPPRAAFAPAPAREPEPPAPSPERKAEGDGYSLDPLRPEPPQDRTAQAPEPKPRAPQVQTLELGGKALPNGVNLNLTQQGVVAAVGQDQLTRERVADGERRKSTRRGSWQGSGFERWRAAIENYVSSVKTGNQTALNTAHVPFASYLTGIHIRIHPIFADDFLVMLDGLPQSHPLNDPKMFARLEIVLSRDDGHVVKMGVVKTSGATAFDIAALDSVQRASPFGKPPAAIVSSDGNVYLHWEFHRDPNLACSTWGARPFMLNLPPAAPPSKPPSSPKPPGDPREKGYPPDSRHGVLAPPRSGDESGRG